MMERTLGDGGLGDGGFDGGTITTERSPGRRPAPKKTLICFSHLRWDFVFQRPGHLLSRAAEDYHVIYMEEPVLEASDDQPPRLETLRLSCGVERIIPHIPHGMTLRDRTAFLKKSVDALLLREKGNTVVGWYYTPMALAHTDHLTFDLCVYDCMDELAAFKDAPSNLTLEEDRLLARADIVFTGGVSLYEAKSKRHDNVHAFPSSVDRAHFEPARKTGRLEPADLAAITHPRIGYFGVIDERLNYPLLDSLAASSPDWQFVMIGPTAKVNPDELPKRANIHWLGGKLYSDLPEYLAFLDAGFMPFAINDATRFISPTKTPEFLAAGLPVVSTPISDVVRTYGATGLVEIAETLPAMTQGLETALALRASGRRYKTWIRRADHMLGAMSWDMTWSQMNKKLRAELASVSPAANLNMATATSGAA